MIDCYGWNRLLIVVAAGCFVQVDLRLAAKLWRPWQYIHIFTVIKAFIFNSHGWGLIGELPLTPAVLPFVYMGGFFR